MENKTILNQIEQIVNQQVCPDFNNCIRSRHYHCDECGAFMHMDQVFLVQDIRRPHTQNLPYYLCANHATDMQQYYERLNLKADKHFIIRRLVK